MVQRKIIKGKRIVTLGRVLCWSESEVKVESSLCDIIVGYSRLTVQNVARETVTLTLTITLKYMGFLGNFDFCLKNAKKSDVGKTSDFFGNPNPNF